MFIFFVLTGITTGFSLIVLPSSGALSTSVSKAIFNYTNWTLIWTILFVYSIQTSVFAVFFGQFFQRRNYLFSDTCSISIRHLYFSSIGQIARSCCMDCHIHRLLSYSTVRRSIFPLSIPQCWTTILPSSSTTIRTTRWFV